ncbi:MAG TPA: DUF3311 domain-containing protein [Kineosporiaceae bacterium]|nr:DUF3311 domain-containing protein [Kineosporiaceae bacterium]
MSDTDTGAPRPGEPGHPDRGRIDRRSERSPWNWLLLLPLLAVLYPPLYNRTDPWLFGMPFFYWYQLAVIPVSVVCTLLVYRAGRRKGAR